MVAFHQRDLYSYVNNNPLTNVDPTGFCSTQFVFTAGSQPGCGGSSDLAMLVSAGSTAGGSDGFDNLQYSGTIAASGNDTGANDSVNSTSLSVTGSAGSAQPPGSDAATSNALGPSFFSTTSLAGTSNSIGIAFQNNLGLSGDQSNEFAPSQPGDFADSLFTPGLNLPAPNLATANLPGITGLTGANAAFVYGTLGGASIGGATGFGIALTLAPEEMSMFATAARVGYAVGETSPLWAPYVGIDTMVGLSFAGTLGGAVSGGVLTLSIYGLYLMSQVPSPPSGQGYGYPNGNFFPY